MAPRLFLHGVPDTPAMWAPLFEALGGHDGPVFTPAMPGFVEPTPAGFPATMQAYADWLLDELDRVADRHGPVDLVGHDWGALLALRVAHLRPAAIRTWTLVNGAFDPEYRGHAFARLWARPWLGPLSTTLSGPLTTRAIMRLCAVPPALAASESANVTREMKRCIVRLYRSAGGLREFGSWNAGLDALPPRGLLVWSDRDPFLPTALAERVAARAGAALHIERGASHWLPLQRPAALAAVLQRHWG